MLQNKTCLSCVLFDLADLAAVPVLILFFGVRYGLLIVGKGCSNFSCIYLKAFILVSSKAARDFFFSYTNLRSWKQRIRSQPCHSVMFWSLFL